MGYMYLAFTSVELIHTAHFQKLSDPFIVPRNAVARFQTYFAFSGVCCDDVCTRTRTYRIQTTRTIRWIMRGFPSKLTCRLTMSILIPNTILDYLILDVRVVFKSSRFGGQGDLKRKVPPVLAKLQMLTHTITFHNFQHYSLD